MRRQRKEASAISTGPIAQPAAGTRGNTWNKSTPAPKHQGIWRDIEALAIETQPTMYHTCSRRRVRDTASANPILG
jgi:hypothetical protein